MKNRILSIFLCLVLLVTSFPVAEANALPVSELQASQAMVDILKKMEGFAEKPYWDNTQWSVGYGTSAKNQEDLDRYHAEGISREEAEELLRYHLGNKGASIDKMITKYNLDLNQGQYDGLLSLTYNTGAGWTTRESTLRQAVTEGWTGSKMLFAFGVYCISAGSINKGLVRRRMREANMYINGQYSMDAPENYSYVMMEVTLGLREYPVQIYDVESPTEIFSQPMHNGYVFDGWYTQPFSGKKVELLDESTKEIIIYTHWRGGDSPDAPQTTPEKVEPTPVNYNREMLVEKVTAFATPAKGAKVVNVLPQGRVVQIVGEFTDSNGITWGQLADGGWIHLEASQNTNKDPDKTVEVTVTADGVNIRSGPSVNYGVVGSVSTGKKLIITETVTATGYLWGKFEDGWIALQFTNYDDVTAVPPPTEPEEPTEPSEEPTEPSEEPTEPSEEPTEPTEPESEVGPLPRMGTITGDKLRVRSGPGSDYTILDHLDKGERVEILAVERNGEMLWGQISDGWISMDYVQLDPICVTGSITGATADVTVTLLQDGKVKYTATGKDGFSITDVATGSYTLVAEAQDGYRISCEITVKSKGVEKDITFTPQADLVEIKNALELEGAIGVHYYLRLAQGVTNPEVKLWMGDNEKTVYPGTLGDDGRYGYKYDIYAMEMADTIYAEITLEKDGFTYRLPIYEYSAVAYAKLALSSESTSAELKNLIAALLNYGGYAQVFFGYSLQNLAYTILPEYGYSTVLNPSQVHTAELIDGTDFTGDVLASFSGNALELNEQVCLRYTFTLDASVNAEDVYMAYRVRGSKGAYTYVKAEPSGDKHFAKIENIGSYEYDTYYDAFVCVKTATGYTQISQLRSYSAACYAATAMTKTEASYINLKNCMVAMMTYGNLAKAQFG